MEITIIGSGNVAAALAGAVAGQDSLHLKQLCARNPLRGRELADRYGAEYIARPEETAEADLYLIAVSDSAVEEVSARLRTPPGATVAHTSGGLGIDSLRCVAADRAVCYPLRGVFACNFSNHLYAIAGRLLEKEGLDFGILGPLVLETAAKAVATDNPAAVQTGPAVRGDTVTMRRHEAILARENDERYNKIYKLLSESIWETSKKI